MKNNELLNPDSENNNENGAENLNPQQPEEKTEKPEKKSSSKTSKKKTVDKTDEKEIIKTEPVSEKDISREEVSDTGAEAPKKKVKKAASGKAEGTNKSAKKASEEEPAEQIEEPAKEKKKATKAKARVKKDDVENKETENKEVTTEEVSEDKTDKKASESEVSKDTEKKEEKPAKEIIASKTDKKDYEKEETEDSEDELTEKYSKLKKEELAEAVEALVMHEDINYIRRHIGYIKVAFRNRLKEESVSDYEINLQKKEVSEEGEDMPEVVDEMVVRFDKAFGVYKQKKTVYDQAVEKQKHDNLKAKEEILEELRQLIESEEELKKTYDVFKELQEKWREIGPVPQSANNTLWNNYHFLVEKFFDKVKINKELRDLDLKKNLETKTELCEKAEELLLESSINKSFQKLQKLHEAWKEIGPVPKDKKDEIWDRFKAASDAINERRQSYYGSLREEQNKNYAAKIVLCEKAEQLVETVSQSPREWQKATDQINELFRVWKTIGFAPKKVNDEVWVRFRTALDNFFKHKKEFFRKYKDEQTENYNQKLNLCLQAEALKDSEDWKKTTDELIALQQQWKKIGPVPRKFSDKVWKRFRTACDEFFNRKAEYFSNIGGKQEENLKKKKELIEKIKTHKYSTDNTENLNILKEFQRQWMEIGFVPFKQKDAIQNEFRKTINEQFDKLNISRKVKSTIGFKHKIENLKKSPNADNIINKERSFLMGKINALENDIKLWENNIGFFASSKKADVLKSEFENKIEMAKSDITVLQEKLRILNESQS